MLFRRPTVVRSARRTFLQTAARRDGAADANEFRVAGDLVGEDLDVSQGSVEAGHEFDQHKGGVIAASNMLSFVGIFLAAGLYFVFSSYLHFSAARIFLVGNRYHLLWIKIIGKSRTGMGPKTRA